MENSIQRNRAEAVFEAGRTLNQATHAIYDALHVLAIESDSREYMKLARKQVLEAQFFIGQSESALREEQTEDTPSEDQAEQKKVISVGSVVACINGFLHTGKKHLEIYYDQNGELCWRGLDGRPEREYAEKDVFWLPNAVRRRPEDLLYAFVTLVSNREGYTFLSSDEQ